MSDVKPVRPRNRDMRVLASHIDGKPFRITSLRESYAVGTLRDAGFLEKGSGIFWRITPIGRRALTNAETEVGHG